ncbi:transposase [uncultured Allofournierella sp.]|uniref:transposase n=1 Tax=uncultured Allofournierella sp. TaxID=1940258 RepID=UPI003750C57A
MVESDKNAGKEHRKSMIAGICKFGEHASGAINFKNIYEFVENLYCEDNGRPSVDPVALFKIVLIQHIYGIPSLRRTMEEVSVNLAYRWFIRYTLNKAVSHFSTVSDAFGRTMWGWQSISGTWRCTKNCTGYEKRKLSVCLPMRRKSTVCVTYSTEAWPR